MPYKKKQATPGTVQFNKLITELPEKREKIKAQIVFRHDRLESQKRLNYKNEFDQLQGVKKYQDWMPTRNQECEIYRRKQGNH